MNHKEFLLSILKEQFNTLPQSEIELKIDSIYLPLFAEVSDQLQQLRSKNPKQTLLYGISAPQGCGKTTLTSILVKLFDFDGKRAVSMSLDDFYLTGKIHGRGEGESSL